MDDMTFLARDFLCFLLSFFYLFFLVAFPVFSSFFLLWNMFCEFVVFFSSRKQHFCRTPNDQAKRPNKGYLTGVTTHIIRYHLVDIFMVNVGKYTIHM